MTAKSEARSRPQLHWAIVGFALSLLLPSTAVIQRYLGLIGVAGYLLVASLVLLLFVKVRHSLARFAARATRQQVLWLADSSFLLFLIAFVLVYPVADSGIVGGGSDDVERSSCSLARWPFGEISLPGQRWK
jgi:hypothetical protein